MYKKDNQSIIVECDCKSHLVSAEIDEENGYIYLAMFTYGNGHSKPNFWERLKRALTVLRTGELYADNVVMRPSEGVELARFLLDNPYPKNFSITVNGKVQSWNKRTISYEDLLMITNSKSGASATYNSKKDELSGILSPTGSIRVYDGMIFNIHHTTNA